ncbi:hypothetical protein [uncultured Helicobacter sp.]|uniref:hypothetical protein n=1 Tax=uncultured Helicobacter sp. TaxID=175537 RepID=UPI002614CABE|nr:hypothetical protein [uncultured Helicobacter sp.]
MGYVLGSEILHLLINPIHKSTNSAIVEVEKDLRFTKDGQRIAEDGIIDKSPLIRQSNCAFKIPTSRNFVAF